MEFQTTVTFRVKIVVADSKVVVAYGQVCEMQSILFGCLMGCPGLKAVVLVPRAETVFGLAICVKDEASGKTIREMFTEELNWAPLTREEAASAEPCSPEGFPDWDSFFLAASCFSSGGH